MEDKKDISLKQTRLSSDTNYFHNVFKKTEKILSVILYILSESGDSEELKLHKDRIRDKVLRTHEAALETLALRQQERERGLEEFRYRLVGLESSVRMAQLSGALPQNLVDLVIEQIDTVYRYLSNHYQMKEPVSFADLTEMVVEKATSGPAPKAQKAAPQRRAQRVQVPAGDISTDAYLVYSQLTDRAERIKTVLEAKPQATVKDISEVITDVSEKTIQRELNSLIEKGQVIREGERRWSRYSVKK
jgi:DNA-binding transcriptional ArsR family regulator